MHRDEYREFLSYLSVERIRRSGVAPRTAPGPDHRSMDDLIQDMAPGYADHKRHERQDAAFDAAYIQSVARVLSRATDIAEDIGMLDVVEEYDGLIIEGMTFEDLPAEDIRALRLLGETSARGALLAAFLQVKRRGTLDVMRQEPTISPLVSSLRGIETRLRNAGDALRPPVVPTVGVRHPSRRWFKGLGKIAQGAALTLADVCMAGGLLTLPVSPETQGWGAIVSSITGIGTVLEGAGELRAE
ncbi:MAG: hypothetical protein IT355_06905 [Gemmatimonadaceae bacterium]|nr:hypothetical protein [Gemmatimonadaceae bacterium]